MKQVKHIFFDLDHTLWDFETNSSETLRELFEEFELQRHINNRERFIATYQTVNGIYWKLYRDGKIDKETVRFKRFEATLERFNIENAGELGREIGNKYVERSPKKNAVFPDTYETLAALQKKYPLHIITNGFSEILNIKLEHSQLRPYFDIILSSEEVGRNKPHRSVFEAAMAKANTSPAESVMIGDNLEADIEGGLKAGMHAIWFNPKKEKNPGTYIEIHGLKELLSIF